MKKMIIMKMIFIFAAAALWQSSGFAGFRQEDPEVIKDLNVDLYAGSWFEVAHKPNFFQRDCVRSSAEYNVMTANALGVRNVCYKADGSVSEIEGVGKIENPEEPGKLKVRFNFLQRGDYWIVDLDPAYQWAVVSGPRKKSLFILTRTVPIDTAVLKKILGNLKQKGFGTDDLIFDELP